MIKVGLCGTGFMGGMHAACYAAMDGVKVVAVADKRREFADKAAKAHGAKIFSDAARLIREADIDVADICLPTYLHTEYALMAAKRGLGCFCEKPMALTVSDCNRIVKAVNKARIPFMVGQVIRFWPEYVRLQEYFQKKTLGRLRALSLVRVSPCPTWTWNGWMTRARLSGSAGLDLHIHDADFVRCLLGTPRSVHSVGVFRNGGCGYIFTNYRYPNMAVSAEGGWNMPAGYPFEMNYRAVFEKGTLLYSSLDTPLTLHQANGRNVKVRLPQPKVKATGSGGNISALGGYFTELQYFTNCLKRGRRPQTATAEDGRDSVALVRKELASAARNAKR